MGGPNIQTSDYVGDSLDKLILSNNKTVNLDNSMSTSEILALVNDQPRNLNGYTLTFQFADGTYNLSNTLDFRGFHGGTLYIHGNTSETDATVKHTTQQVHLNGASVDGNVIFVFSCQSYIQIRNLKVTVKDYNNAGGIVVQGCCQIFIQYNYVVGSGKSNARAAIRVDTSIGGVYSNYVSNIPYGIDCNFGKIYSYDNDDTGTQPNYGLLAGSGATIGKGSTQPTGSISNETTGNGAVIR